MKKNEIVVGGHYTAKISNVITTVRVDKITESKGKPARVVPASPNGTGLGSYTAKAIRSVTYYDVTNLRTGRATTFNSAAKFRSEVKSTMGRTTDEEVKAVRLGQLEILANSGELTDTEADELRMLQTSDMLSEGEQRPDPTAFIVVTPAPIKTIPADKPTADSAEVPSPGVSELPTTPHVFTQNLQRTDKEVEVVSRMLEVEQRLPFVSAAVISETSAKPSSDGASTSSTAQILCGKALLGGLLCKLPSGHEGRCEGSLKTPTSSFAGVSSVFTKIAQAIKSEADAPHVQLKALAGTGKTTSCIEGLKHVKGLGASITPSQQQSDFWAQLALGKSDTVRLSAFNTSITDELKGRLAACGLDKMGVEARGVHSLGNAAVYKQFGRLQASEWATKDLVCEALGKDFYDLKKQPGMLTLINAATDLVSLCKQNLCEPTPEELERLASHYDVDTDKQMAKVCEIVPQVLDASRAPKGRIHFDDMVWLPIVLGLPIPQVDVQVIDEQQDLNRMQQELVYRAGRRVTGVGDEHQAIYGFAGADAESMKRMATTLAGTLRGCVVLPLTVTRRCGKAIVREAQQWVPEFSAHESNGQGSVDSAKYPTQKNPHTGKTEELPWDQTYLKHVKDGAMVLCRVNAPLVSQCFKFLKRGIKAQIMGRKIGEGLVSLVEKSKIEYVPSFLAWLSNWVIKEQEAENKKKFPSQTKLDLVADKADCLMAFCDGLLRTTDVVQKVKSVFTDAKDVRGIRLSSIHKSKGLEADQVFFLQPKGGECPHPMAKSAWQREQERNLAYVATTRAIKELFIVR